MRVEFNIYKLREVEMGLATVRKHTGNKKE